MFLLKIFQLYCLLQMVYGGWVSDWMLPVQNLLKQMPSTLPFGDDDAKIPYEAEIIEASLKDKLQNTLQNTKAFAEVLRVRIIEKINRETRLKETIVNGVSGVTTVTVSTLSELPKTYIIRDGMWTQCTGLLQHPVTSINQFSAPQCLGRELFSKRDPCVFNSVIKYATIPSQRRVEYDEDNYVCLKPIFNNTLEQYYSVPKKIINETCVGGIARSVTSFIQQCSLRIMADYTYYPHRTSSIAPLPLEYCTEKDGTCKLITAWHISNTSIDNYEFLKDEIEFKSYFIKLYYPY